jgi:hypothetical protein
LKPGLHALAAIWAVSGCGLVGQTQPKLRTAVDARREPLTTCYRELLTRQPRASGSMALTLNVRHEQRRVTAVGVVRAEPGERRFVSCITSILRRIELSEAPTSNLSVHYTLTFDQVDPDTAEGDPPLE